MEQIDKIYSVEVCEYHYIQSQDFLYRNKIINFYHDLYTLEEAIQVGKNSIRDYCYNIIFSDVNDDELPDDITDNQFEDFISEENKNFKKYIIIVNIISGNRKRFNTSKELMDYFNNNIKNISNDNLYDFLLSLVTSQSIWYDENGNIINSYINTQCPLLEFGYSSDIDFNEEDCKKGVYTFKYD